MQYFKSINKERSFISFNIIYYSLLIELFYESFCSSNIWYAWVSSTSDTSKNPTQLVNNKNNTQRYIFSLITLMFILFLVEKLLFSFIFILIQLLGILYRDGRII